MIVVEFTNCQKREVCVRIGILECDDIAPELSSDFATYPVMFEQLLRKAELPKNGVEFVVFRANHGELPEDVHMCDAYLITGSKTGVYDDVPWRTPLRQLVKNVFDANVRIAGICFGHQLLADVLGGKAEKSTKGWGIGAITHQRHTIVDFVGEQPEELTLLFSHQDQVIELPTGAERLYGSDFCNNGAYWVPNKVLAFQGHPEFTKDYSERLMRLREQRYPAERFVEGIDSLVLNTDELLVAQWIVNFLTASVNPKEG